MLRKIIYILPILLLFFLFFLVKPTQAQNKVNLYFFYGDGCPHCAKEEKFLDKLEKEYDNLNINRYEVWQDRDNAQLLAEIAKELNFTVSGVPFLIIGDETVSGYYNDETTGEKIKSIIDDYAVNGCNDIVAPMLGTVQAQNQCIHGCDANDEACMHECGCDANLIEGQNLPDKINIPFIGEINIKNFSLPILTILIAATDGFNPCAMWVLLFLISLLLGMENKKRMWILGSAFIIASGTVYFLFLTAWLNLFLFLGFVLWIRVTIGIVALASGGYHLYDFYRNRPGCPVTDSEKRRLIFTKLRQIAGAKQFWLALGGVILLAAAVNLVELVCSAGLPAVYTQILVLANLPAWQHYIYLFLYIVIYMFDDMLVFIIAMLTLQMKAVSSRYTRWAGLIGGVVMAIIGILLLFKPGWIMFG